nr:hypothetical protein [Tanacetum cinerariifolium]
MSVKYPKYVNLTPSSEEQPNEKTPSPPPRKKSLSPPQAISNPSLAKVHTTPLHHHQVHPAQILRSDVFESASDSNVNESEKDNNQANDRYKASEGYHAVPPPYTGNFMPLRPDLYFAGLDDSIFKSAISETVTSLHETETSASKTNNKEVQIIATIDGKIKLVSEASIRRHIKLEDSNGISTFPNTKIFEQLALMGHREAATTVSSLYTGHGSGNIDKTPSMPHDSPLPRLNTHGSDECEVAKVHTYTRKRMRISIASGGISTAEESVSTAGMVYKGKVIMQESKSKQTTTKLQPRQERASYEASERLQEQLDEEERQRISRVYEEARSFNVEE